jgi:phosphoglycerate dehydrogenase-like enzyme
MSAMADHIVRRVAVVGTGAIGTSWCIRFLAHGLDVVGYDPVLIDLVATKRAARHLPS